MMMALFIYLHDDALLHYLRLLFSFMHDIYPLFLRSYSVVQLFNFLIVHFFDCFCSLSNFVY